MKSEWRVQANIINGELWYIPFRIRNKSEVVHSGNVEYPEGVLYSRDEAQAQALADLNKWYNEQSLAGSKAYYESLVASAEQTGVFAEGGAYAGTIEELTQVGELMDGVAKGTVSETELANALAGLDEAQVVEVTNAISAMEQAAASAGASLPMQLLENAREWLAKAKERGDPREIETAMRLVERNERLTTLKV